MIFIVVKFSVRPDRSHEWLDIVADFTAATRTEPGNLFFDWARSVDDPHQFILTEAFVDGDAGSAHVNSDHFKKAMAVLPDAISETPEIINVEVPGNDWARMTELQPSSS